MQIFVKNFAGETTSLSIPDSSTVGDVRSRIASTTSAPTSELRLVYAGLHLRDDSASLAAHDIRNESTIHMALPLRGGAPPRKPKCGFKDCKDAAQRIIGDCGFCSGHFCGKHRMLESHNCSGLEACKNQAKDRNREKLESERTYAVRIVI